MEAVFNTNAGTSSNAEAEIEAEGGNGGHGGDAGVSAGGDGGAGKCRKWRRFLWRCCW